MLWDNFAAMQSLKQSYNIQLQRHRQHAQRWRTKRIATVMEEQGEAFLGHLKDEHGNILHFLLRRNIFSFDA